MDDKFLLSTMDSSRIQPLEGCRPSDLRDAYFTMRLAPLRFRSLLIFLSLLGTLAAFLQGCAEAINGGGNNTSPPPALEITTPSSLPSGQVGTAYSATLAATGGTTPYKWALTSGTRPAGLKLNASTGAITGTPTQAVSNTSLTFKVTGSGSPAQTQSATL